MASKQFSTEAMLKAVTRTSDMGDVLALDVLRLDGGTQPRAVIDHDVVAEYAEAMREGAVFPPVVVYHDGEHYWLADGFHRVHAARAAGLDSIRAEVKSGSVRDAVLYSVGANATHGLRRKDSDKRRAVERLLRDEVWGTWSNREIANACRVSHPFVGKVRAELIALTGNSLPVTDSGERTYTTKHGTTATMRTGHIREANRRRARPRDPNAEAVFGPGASVPAHDLALKPGPEQSPTPEAAPVRHEAIDEAMALPRGQVYAGRAKVDGAYGAQVSLRFLDGVPNVQDGKTYRITVEEVTR